MHAKKTPPRQSVLRLCRLTFAVSDRLKAWNRACLGCLNRPAAGFLWNGSLYMSKMLSDTTSLLAQADGAASTDTATSQHRGERTEAK
mmetsp:Transcript_50114/g.108926  ORF Transcript_50114/g.108926 Transcript_50114/m.108926 type:complete len:88 (-) Transcript_50114:147-410(-)